VLCQRLTVIGLSIVANFGIGVASVATADETKMPTIIDLGATRDPGGALAVNGQGDVVGAVIVPDGTLEAFLYSHRKEIVGLSSLGGTGGRIAYGINQRGDVVGSAGNVAFLFTRATGMQALRTLGGSSGIAYAINDREDVVGFSTLPGDQAFHPTLWSRGSVMDLGTLGDGNAIAYAINDVGQIVGQYSQSLPSGGGSTYRAFVYQDGLMRDIGTLGGNFSSARAINSRGEIVGYADPGDGTGHAFLYSNGKMIDLGTFGFTGSSAHAINDHGQIVGTVRQGNGDTLAVLFFRGQGILLLNGSLPPDSGWNLTSAVGINDSGVIVGNGYHNGELRAYSLTLANDLACQEDTEQ
jgi:probable HAF family extracellular repeat protein